MSVEDNASNPLSGSEPVGPESPASETPATAPARPEAETRDRRGRKFARKLAQAEAGEEAISRRKRAQAEDEDGPRRKRAQALSEEEAETPRRKRAQALAEEEDEAPRRRPARIGDGEKEPGRRKRLLKGGPERTSRVPQLPAARSPAGPARIKRRHLAMGFSFLLFVLAPALVSGWYLWTRAADQYASYLGFSVRSETAPAPSEILGGLGSLMGMSNSSSSDTDILYKFIQSHDLVERVDAKLDLRGIWSKAPHDPVFGYTGNDSLEDLLSEWERKVRVYYDDGMIDLRVLAFDPEDARKIAQEIYDEGTILINQLNDVAREDTLRYAREELDEALTRLKAARQAMTEFRNRHQMVDPAADVQGQVGVVSSLQQQLAEALVSLGTLKANAQPTDPRIEQADLRIRVIREQIDAERQKFGSETASGEVLSEVVGQYESLAVDREFAERTYTAALAGYDTARAEATRQTRYLAAYVKPTLAQEAEYPERSKLMLIISGFLLVIWTIGVLIFYSLRDRR